MVGLQFYNVQKQAKLIYGVRGQENGYLLGGEGGGD